MKNHPSHEQFMRRALALARRGMGRVSPNPMVGAVLVRRGTIIAEGYHLYRTRTHAEALALERAGSQARGATLYLNLEPCSHQGRTPPCADRIIQSGVSSVFVAVRDPDRRVNGRGIRRLRRAGVRVHEGLLREEAMRLNESFFHYAACGRPLVLLKLALSLDGRIATRRGSSRWITGPRARRFAHRLRYQSDAILVGCGTVLSDDPFLDVRWHRRNAITKVILDARLRTPPGAHLFESGDRVLIFHARGAPHGRREQLRSRAELVSLPCQGGQLQWSSVLEALGERAISSVLVEGGARVATSALLEKVVDRVFFLYGPCLIGGDGRPGVESLKVRTLAEAPRLSGLRTRRLGEDLLVEGKLS